MYWRQYRACSTTAKALRLKMQDSRGESGGSGGNGNSDYKEGQRNDALFRDACGFRAKGRSFERTLELTRALNLSACKPPLDDQEVVGIVESAFTLRTRRGRMTRPKRH